MLLKNKSKLTNGYNFFLLSLLLFCSKIAAGGEVRITNVSGFKNFVNDVNSGASDFDGITVLLDSDLSLSGEETLEPIGKDYYSNSFRGVFDGQGHIISDLKIGSTSRYTGLFGYSNGLTIRNIVLDSSCSVANSFSGSGTIYLGGIIGECYAYSGHCNIENSVSMADVTFSGSTSTSEGYLLIGGVAGRLYSGSRYPAYMKNCANYGSVTHSGTSKSSYIGGIVGDLSGSGYTYKYLYNCLNYGTITYSGTTSRELRLGGIVGYSRYTYVENCASSGRISTINAPSESYIGGIVGYVGPYTYINYCYYTSDLSEYGLYGKGAPKSSSYTFSYNNATFKLDEPVSIGSYTVSSLVDALNVAADFYFLRDYSEWLLNKEKKSVNFTINSRANPITMDSQIILLPSLASEGSLWFDGWYNDNEYTHPLESFEVTVDTKLYGRFEGNTNSYTITFDTRRKGSSVGQITARFGTVVILPSKFVEGQCSFAFWETEYGDDLGSNLTMPAHNFTLYAVWKCTHLVTPDNFIDFPKVVNSGKDDFNGITVLLDSDLSFSNKILKPIGDDYYNRFLGTFDGQGHVISDLTINTSSSEYTGLFGYSEGLTIRNVVLDSSCSVLSSYSGSGSVDIGGIIGDCSAYDNGCNIENSVNMADVTFSGGTGISKYNLYLGGVAGIVSSYSSFGYSIYVKNCVNYGSVIHSGTRGYSYIGGIVGDLDGSSEFYAYIQNSLNYGTITHRGTTSSYLYLGGIAGHSYYAYIENCVSAGKISIQNTPSYSRIGSIVGYVDTYYTSINYCYYTSELSGYKIYGTGTPESSSYTFSYNSITFKLNKAVSVGNYTGTSLVDALNAAAEYYILRDYSKWLLNKEKKSVNFTINSRANPITMDSQIILLPSLASEGSLMFRWYNDNEYTHPLESFEITEDKMLYGIFEENTKNYTITFDTKKESVFVAPITTRFGAAVSLTNGFMEGQCSFAFWETEYGDNVGLSLAMPAHSFTLYAVWKCTHLVTPDDFIDFSKVVNSGKDDFNGITVLLDSDLSFSNKIFRPIGKDDDYYFRGTFDGQGHIINNFKMNTTLKYTGLFGYSEGLIIRNVVLDSSCSVTSSYKFSSYRTFVGGILGWCISDSGECSVENSVNMASVTFNGVITNGNELYLGGAVGCISASTYGMVMKNCANYGTVTNYGVTYGITYIGGVIGTCGYGALKYVQNCINYGTIVQKGETGTSSLHIGGITGWSQYTDFSNCASAGKIITQNIPSASYIGSIVGYVYYRTSIKYCYYTSDVGEYPINGSGTPTIDDETSQAKVNMTLVNKLNSYASDNNRSKWLLNTNNASTTFKINNNAGFIVNFQIILLPDLVDNEERSFSGWYTDAMLTLPFTGNEVNAETTLYGMFCGVTNYTVTFDANGGNDLSEGEDKMVIKCNGTYGALPAPTRKWYTFIGWFTERERGKKIEQGDANFNNHTLYAHWKIINYTVTFDVNGGNALPVPTMTVMFNNTYGALPVIEKPGYMFMGWFTEKTNGTKVTNETVVTIPNNHTLYAHWEEITNYVKVAFSKKGLTKSEAEETLKQYTNAEFTIVKYEVNELGEIIVIVKFTNREDAKKFVGEINKLGGNCDIKANFVFSDDESFSLKLYPTLLSIVMLLL